ncbi:bifunctional hydroxymethylpyrimidine kinase/phosphomethylpyrimidine kinase [Paucibacter sp. hw1]|uniref:hydroxymethylpyrimidine kinase n=1 Tax=Roseateles koreensis TaxID=2987526 RepID=A0ABT5KQX9_9BURK|nr:bifunctional hydroxymethylpyrimidine kinase/phosphomethylpyrimidine kinase [Roseateles koreensis]
MPSSLDSGAAPADRPAIIWSVAGTDSGGGAGLAADLRAASAMGVHLCPVVAVVTAQNSLGVQSVHPVPVAQLQAQLDALAQDCRPRAIKCGLLASVEAIECLARCVDALRRDGPVALVIDPVLSATAGGAAFSNAALVQAYRTLLLPRATLLTPNRREAESLAERTDTTTPALARHLLATGAQTVCITGGDDLNAPGAAHLALDWLDAQAPAEPPVAGWLALPRLPSRHHHGSGCTFATAAAAALARGYPLADAVVLAKMLSWSAVRQGYAAGAGAGPVKAEGSFIQDPRCMPVMGFADETTPSPQTLRRWRQALAARPVPGADQATLGLYAITDQATRVGPLLAQGLSQVQLRIKTASGENVQEALHQSLKLAQQQQQPGQLWINDHWREALAAGATALHLGQEDWAALNPEERSQILNSGARLGLSSHSLWELARARGLTPNYIACGPVYPTTTKDMPWRPQGMRNLRWWATMAGCPVVAIGGLLSPEQVQDCAETGAAAACLVRALKPDMSAADLRHFQTAWMNGRARRPLTPPV